MWILFSILTVAKLSGKKASNFKRKIKEWHNQEYS